MKIINLLSILFLIFFTIVFSYFDLKYKKIPNIFFFIWLVILLIFMFFFKEYWLEFFIRTFMIFFVFYFLWIQDRVAWWDFKLYFILTSFLAIFILSYWWFKIHWLYYDISIIIYSLIVWFVYLIFRYFFIYLSNLFTRRRNLYIDDFIKYKFMVDYKDAYIHFSIFIRILVYSILTYISFLFKTDYVYLSIFIIIIEFVFMWWFIIFLKDTIYIPFIHIIRKKQFKYSVWFIFCGLSLFSIYYKTFFLIFFSLFWFLDYIIIILQLNFDTKIEDIKNLKWKEKISIRSFEVDFDKLDLLEEYIYDEVKEHLKNTSKVEIITEIPYGIFIVFGIIWFILANF